GRFFSGICPEFLPHSFMCGRTPPAIWTKSLASQARHPARGRSVATSARSLLHTSQESSVRRIFDRSPTRNLRASVAEIEATKFTAEFRIPAVSHVSTVPRGGSEKIQARQAVSPGKTFNVAA